MAAWSSVLSEEAVFFCAQHSPAAQRSLDVLTSLACLLFLCSGLSPSPFILQVDRVIVFGQAMNAKLINKAKQLFWQHVNPKCLFVGVLLRTCDLRTYDR